MQKHFCRGILRILFLSFLFFPALFGQKGYFIKTKIKYFAGDYCILAYHFGTQKYVVDTVPAKKETCIFQADTLLPPGIYLIVFPPNNTFIEIVLEEKDQHLVLKSDTLNFIEHLNVKGNLATQLFYAYLRFLANLKKQADTLNVKLKNVNNKADSVKIQEKLQALDEQLKHYKAKLYQKYPNNLWIKILKAMEEPNVPDSLEKLEAYYYYKTHFFDQVDFSEPGLLRTPVLHQKVEKYLSKVIPASPDSHIVAVDEILSKAKAHPEVFKYFLITLLNRYATSQIMGMDAVYVHLVREYYQKGLAPWVDKTQLYKMIDKANQTEPNLIGKIAPEIVLKDSLGIYRSLHAVKADYTIVYFWDPDCGHCKKATPKLKKMYDELKPYGVEVYAVYGGPETEKWKKYIQENHLNWINVHDPQHESDYRYVYDVFSTPTIYLLDHKKKIIAKRLSVEQLNEFLRYKMKEDGKPIETLNSTDNGPSDTDAESDPIPHSSP